MGIIRRYGVRLCTSDFGNTNEEQRVLFTMWDTPFLFLRHLQLTRQWIDGASDNRLIFKKAKHEASLTY